MQNLFKMSSFTIVVTIALVVWAAAFSGSAPQTVAPEISKGCNTHSLAGTYAYSAFGTIHPDHPLGFPPGPYSSAGVVTLKADGTYSLVTTTSLNGTIIPESVTDEYEIGENCEVTLMFMGFPYTVTYTSRDRTEIFGIVLVPKTNVTIIGAGK